MKRNERKIAKAALFAAIVVAIIFAVFYSIPLPNVTKSAGCIVDSDCATGGCSRQVCTYARDAASLVTTCEWRAEYDCLHLTQCGCVAGSCAWKNTDVYSDCLAELSR